jgi:hypothetical protein
MNRDWVLTNLREANEELTRTIADIERDATYDFGEYRVAMQHLYHHLNTAWNARDASPLAVQASTDAIFNRWSALPSDLPMMEV